MIDDRSSRQESPRSPEPGVRSVPIPLDRMESAPTEDDQFPASMSHPGRYISTDPRGRYKAHEVSLNVDVEGGLEEK